MSRADKTFYLDLGSVTCQDAADAYGKGTQIGDYEWRLLDHPDNPGYSEDFPTLKEATDYAKERGYTVHSILENNRSFSDIASIEIRDAVNYQRRMNYDVILEIVQSMDGYVYEAFQESVDDLLGYLEVKISNSDHSSELEAVTQRYVDEISNGDAMNFVAAAIEASGLDHVLSIANQKSVQKP